MIPRRRLILGLSLAAAIALSVQSLLWTPDSDGSAEVVQPVEHAHAATMQAIPPVPAALRDASASPDKADSLRLRPRPGPERAPRDLFAAYSWLPPPPPPPTPAEAAAAAAATVPQAPPLPFTYGGRLEVEGKSTFLLLEGEHTYRVPIGGLVGDFKLISSGPAGLVFLHPPTGQSQTLAAPGAPVASN